MGYDTNATLYDYPGLESKTVVDALRKAKDSGHPVVPVVGNVQPACIRIGWCCDLTKPRLLADWYPEDARGSTSGAALQRPRWSGPDLRPGVLPTDDIDRDFIVFRRRS